MFSSDISILIHQPIYYTSRALGILYIVFKESRYFVTGIINKKPPTRLYKYLLCLFVKYIIRVLALWPICLCLFEEHISAYQRTITR